MSSIKVILLGLFIVIALSQTAPIEAESQDNEYDGYVSVPLDKLDQVHQYILDSIIQNYDEVEDWQLVDISEKEDQESGNITYHYTFIDMDDDNQTEINDSVTVTVISEDGVKYYIYVDQQFIAEVDSTPQTAASNQASTSNDGQTKVTGAIPPKEESNAPVPSSDSGIASLPLAGGFTQAQIDNLGSIQKDALKFLQANVDLKGWTLQSVRTQVVAGQNTCFKYKNDASGETHEYCVWSKPWENNFMQLTLKDGSKVTSGGLSSNLQKQN